MNDDTTPLRGPRRDNTGDERLEILRLVEEGAINADEASRLLDALAASDRGPGGRADAWASDQGKARNVRIRITDSKSDKPRINLLLPLSMIDAGLGIVGQFAPDRVGNVAAIRDALLSEGVRGPVLDIGDDGERIQIIVE
jgi:hypothetical protein